MEFSKISVLAITLCVACFVTGDLSEDRVSDAWAEFYKSYYEQHSGAEERDLGGFGAPSSSYAEPAAPSTGYGAPATSYDSPAYGASFSDVKGVDLLSPETTVCFNCYNLICNLTYFIGEHVSIYHVIIIVACNRCCWSPCRHDRNWCSGCTIKPSFVNLYDCKYIR